MRRAITTLLLAAGCVWAAEKPTAPVASKAPPPLSTEARKAKEKEEFDAAVAKLPKFDDERLEQVLHTLEKTRFPIPLAQLQASLGGPDSMVWCCTRSSSDARTNLATRRDTYALTDPGAESGTYELLIDFVDAPSDLRAILVGRARLCFRSPLGWTFVAESTSDFMEIGSKRGMPNQSPEPAPGAVH